MVEIIAKLVGIFLFAALGVGLWRQGDAWKAKGEVSKEWVEDKNPRPISSDDSSFGLAVNWQKFMGVLSCFFAALFGLSIIIQIAGMQ